MSSSKRSLPSSDRKTAIIWGARMKRLRESADLLENEIKEWMREVDDLENELDTRKALIAAAEVDLQETNRELAEVEQEFNGIYGFGTKDKTMASLMAQDGGPSQLQAPEELEMKMNKVISGGAATSAVKTWTLRNVVCNSNTVFISHLAGQKHAAMVKKKAEAEV